MGLPIGQASIAVSTAANTVANRTTRPDVQPAAPAEEARLVQREESSAPPAAGFGENTLSPLSAALETLDTNLEVAQEVVPTVEELRARARVAQAERQAQTAEPRPLERPDELRRRESVRPEPDPAVQNFVAEREPTTPNTRLAPPAAPERLETVQSIRPTPDPSARVDFFA